jgi:hypothetical protein
MYKIEFELTDEQYESFEEHRKQQKIRIEDPDDPESTVERPQHRSVADMIRTTVLQQFAPVIHRKPPAQVQQLIREMREKQKQADALLDAAFTVKVTKA